MAAREDPDDEEERGPRSFAQWSKHISALEGEMLWDEVVGANSTRFVSLLQEDGLSAAEIHGVLWLYARRLKETGMRPPDEGYLDLFRLMDAPDPMAPG